METNSQARQVRMILYVTCLPLPNPKFIQCVRWDLQPIMVALSSRASMYQHVSLRQLSLVNRNLFYVVDKYVDIPMHFHFTDT